MKSFLPRVLLFAALAGCAAPALAQDLRFEPPAIATDPALPAALRDLAERIVPVYREEDTDRYLANLAALQITAGVPAAAYATRLMLRDRLQSERGAAPSGRDLVFEIYTQARAIEADDGVPFPTAYGRAFRETFNRLDDRDAYESEGSFAAPAEPLQEAVQRALDGRLGQDTIALGEAVDLVQAWFALDAYRSFSAIARPLLVEDRERRYAIEEAEIAVGENAAVAATVVRPRGALNDGKLPALLEFTLEPSSVDAREAAAHGYVSVVALARVAGDPPSRPRLPFLADGDDARAVIEWIAAQPWSDGRVGLQGTGYGGFVAWSAAKRPPAALAALATSDPMAPGIDLPMSGGIFTNAAYRWLYRIFAADEDETANDTGFWLDLDERWFRSGRRYREFPSLPGRASTVFRIWLNHPSYDAFWQASVPSGDELAAIDFPVLTVTGHYSAAVPAALHYFTEHRRHDHQADHTLLIGPFDGHSVEHGALSSIRGLELDAAAVIDPKDVRYEWLDHVLKGAARPAVLAGNVNYPLAGSNEWRHEPSLEPETAPRRFYLAAAAADGEPNGLVVQPPSSPTSLAETVDLRDRGDAGWRRSQALVVAAIDPREGPAFVSEPFAESVDLVGRVRGRLDVTIDRYDADFVMNLYELTADGKYVKLFEPAYAFRASFARDRGQRQLLEPGSRQSLPFECERLIGRRLAAGSRLVLTLGIDKRADRQVNYGGANDVSEQSLADAGEPMRVQWHEGSYVEIPVR